MDEINTVRRMYDACNARQMDDALAGLHVDVEWDGGAEGILHGKEAVERHWRSQWQDADAKVYMPHARRNESGEPCIWIVVHSSGSDQEGIVLLPELDVKLAQRTAASM